MKVDLKYTVFYCSVQTKNDSCNYITVIYECYIVIRRLNNCKLNLKFKALFTNLNKMCKEYLLSSENKNSLPPIICENWINKCAI